MQIRIAAMLIVAVIFSGCWTNPKSSFGFRLPDGDADMGQEVFVSFQCTACHTVSNLDLPPAKEPGPVSVALGGEVSLIKTYGELVTSIINPSHKLAPGYESDDGLSEMTVYNDVMSVTDLIDVVAFLQAEYEVRPPVYRYRVYE